VIYFDHNATTPVDKRVVEAMLPYITSFYGNPSSLYKMGRLVRSAIDTAREQVAALVDVPPSQLIFTSGGTEANNLVIKSISDHSVIATSVIEHPSISELARQWGDLHIPIPVNRQGVVTIAAIEQLTQRLAKPKLASVMMANNETGGVQNIAEIALLLKSAKILLHTDAVQALGKIPVSFAQLAVDFMSLSSHKIYGPKGCGALVFAKNLNLTPQLIGGGQEGGWRAGTENVAAIVGFGKAAELAKLELDSRAEHCFLLRQQLEEGLKSIPHVTIFSEQAVRLPNTLQFSVEGIDGEMLLMQLDQKNIAVSSGSACASGGGKASAVLTSMGVEQQLAKGAIRVSLGKDNDAAEIKQFITVLKSFVMKG